MISIFLREKDYQDSVINLEKSIYIRIGGHTESVNVMYTSIERNIRKHYAEAFFGDKVVRRISPIYDNIEDAELFIKVLFSKIKSLEDQHNIFIDANEIDLEIQKRNNNISL